MNGATFTKGKWLKGPPPALNPGRDEAQRLLDEPDGTKHQRFHKLRKENGMLKALAIIQKDDDAENE